ncbi:hypothetical protein [Actinokineospora sp.]|uniref:hypothetical protein n=1 Tax=Actinokineospora sp. TaxID=1872133 RepID=UPI003D6B33C0
MAPDQAPSVRPGTAVSAAVLAFIQGSATAMTTIYMLMVGILRDDSAAPAVVGLAVLQVIGLYLLFHGGIVLLQGRGRKALTSGNAMQLVLSCLWVATATEFGGDIDVYDPAGGQTVVTRFAVAFAVLPVISLIQTWHRDTGDWLRTH